MIIPIRFVFVLFTAFACQSLFAQTSPDRTILPPIPPEFKGKIKQSYKDSTPDFSPALPLTAPEGAPNVLMMVLDDVGYGQLGCYGGPIETPNIDRLAANGLRYTNFHTTALCSPTRAALLTGAITTRLDWQRLRKQPLVSRVTSVAFPKVRRLSPRS